MTTIPKKDTAPPWAQSMARIWLFDNDLPAEWEDAVAQEFDAAIADRKIELVRTHEQGRPYDTPLVEWEARELKDTSDVAEMLAEVGEARREVGEGLIPHEDAAEAAASQERWR